MTKKISPEEYWKWDKFEGETSAEDMKEDFKRYVKEHYGKDVEFVKSDNPDTFEVLFPTQHKKYDTSKVKTITLNGKKYVDISVIEDIRKEIEERSFTFFAGQTTLFAVSLEDALEIIDRKVNKVTDE